VVFSPRLPVIRFEAGRRNFAGDNAGQRGNQLYEGRGLPADKEKFFWVALNQVKGIGPVRFRSLINRFGDARSAWEAPESQLAETGIGEKVVNNLIQVRANVDVQSVFDKAQRKGVSILTWLDEGYPRRLAELDQAPPVLYVRGELVPEDEWAVAVVGTRRITHYGQQAAEQIGGFLARNHITVVSGMALGVDTAAHEAALQAGGRTIAVLGSGVDHLYPPQNRRLAEKIMAQGAVISDYPLGTIPEAANFPPRNRIISGLSLAVVVVEAGAKSGALITANFGAEQGRDVFAVPGNIFSAGSKGTNRLIAQGAHPLLNPEDLMDVLNLKLISEHQTAQRALPADATEAKLYELIGDDPIHVDQIRTLAGLPIEKVSATLALMELKGLIRQVGGMNYIAVREIQTVYGTDTQT
jgi:DNA processing protein